MSKKIGLLLLVMGLLLFAGLAVLNVLVPPPVPVEHVIHTARIGATVGQVEVRKSDSNRWVKVKVGQHLFEGDEIRTSLFSEASVHVRGGSTVVVSPNTNFVMGKELVEVSTFKVGAGQITADLSHDSATEYQFHSQGSDAVASANRGEFSLSNDGKGTVIVDTRVGKVKLKAKGKEVVVRKGKRSVVLPDKAPSRVLAIPTSVALQVKWPPRKLDQTKTTVVGKTSAGSLVMVNGILVRADPTGKFSLRVPLREGSNRLVVSVTDSAGNTNSKESGLIKVDTRPPNLKVNAKDLWK